MLSFIYIWLQKTHQVLITYLVVLHKECSTAILSHILKIHNEQYTTTACAEFTLSIDTSDDYLNFQGDTDGDGDFDANDVTPYDGASGGKHALRPAFTPYIMSQEISGKRYELLDLLHVVMVFLLIKKLKLQFTMLKLLKTWKTPSMQYLMLWFVDSLMMTKQWTFVKNLEVVLLIH